MCYALYLEERQPCIMYIIKGDWQACGSTVYRTVGQVCVLFSIQCREIRFCVIHHTRRGIDLCVIQYIGKKSRFCDIQ